LGAKGPKQIKRHPYFRDIDWKLVEQKKMIPPISLADTIEETVINSF